VIARKLVKRQLLAGFLTRSSLLVVRPNFRGRLVVKALDHTWDGVINQRKLCSDETGDASMSALEPVKGLGLSSDTKHEPAATAGVMDQWKCFAGV